MTDTKNLKIELPGYQETPWQCPHCKHMFIMYAVGENDTDYGRDYFIWKIGNERTFCPICGKRELK